MDNIIRIIKSLYGVELSENELNEFIKWFNSRNIDDDNFQAEIESYLSEKYGYIVLNEEDSSQIRYLLMILKKNHDTNARGV